MYQVRFKLAVSGKLVAAAEGTLSEVFPLYLCTSVVCILPERVYEKLPLFIFISWFKESTRKCATGRGIKQRI